MSDLTREQINEILREADGWIYIEHLDSWHLPEIKKPRLMDTVSSRNLPDYTTSYGDLARVWEKLRSSDPKGEWFMNSNEDRGGYIHVKATRWGGADPSVYVCRKDELHARAEVCALVAKEMGR